MELARLPISASQRGKLISAGYTSLSVLSSCLSFNPCSSSISDAVVMNGDITNLKISEDEAHEILRVVSPGSRLDKPDGSHAIVNGAQTAWDMLHEEESLKCITTSCADLDDILGGGIKCKEVTEIGWSFFPS